MSDSFDKNRPVKVGRYPSPMNRLGPPSQMATPVTIVQALAGPHLIDSQLLTMQTSNPKPLPAIGFLTVVESPQHGLFGGYLVLSLQGRPLEFRCTTPVQPTRAQEILYGATLREYLLGEVIGHPLIQQAELRPEVVLTNQQEMLGLGLLCELPIGMVEQSNGEEASPADDGKESIDLSFDGPAICLGNCRVEFATENFLDATAREHLSRLASYVELSEPFLRIEAALAEAQEAAIEEEIDEETVAESTEEQAPNLETDNPYRSAA
ncbi:hypothetical protein [Adhaeretor mobilis]|uniref:Uncharacterized protein n=1 Tax=Adhaeretor mobilis TaxID=1930276 RepID=A0A517N035_9BACT|nr:hypothetical protein [Adhaeretor mobilis]QDT00485.1 hypothetical protein HG15A2_38230 [Adhaeretor mobilis]